MSLLLRVLTLLALVFLIVTQVCLEVHFWMSFTSDDQIGRRLLVMIGAGLAFLEVFMLALAHDAARRGFAVLAWLWRTAFLAVLLVNLPATFGAVAAVTGGDHALRRQSAIVYRQHEAAILRIDADIARLAASFDDPDLNRPSAALRSLLQERQRRRAALEAAGVGVPQALATRIARLESALATAEAIERLAAEREGSLRYLAEHTPPAADHPQTSGIITVLAGLGLEASGEEVRAGLALAMVAVLKVVLNLGFLVATATVTGADKLESAPRRSEASAWARSLLTLIARGRQRTADEADAQAPAQDPDPGAQSPALPPPPPPKTRKSRRKASPRFTDDLDADLDDFG